MEKRPLGLEVNLVPDDSPETVKEQGKRGSVGGSVV